MIELLSVKELKEAFELIATKVEMIAKPLEEVDLLKTKDRIIGEDICALEDVPPFDRATVDGYALLAKDTYGAANGDVFLDVIDKIAIAEHSKKEVKEGQAIALQTGSRLPKGADAVEMVEYTKEYLKDKVVIYRPVSTNENVILRGDDIKKGEVIIKSGKRIDDRTIAVLASLGKNRIKVFKKLKVAIISSGDELCDISKKRRENEIYDINTYALSAYSLKKGVAITATYLLKDDEEKLKEIIEKEKKTADVILLSGGSSKGTKDLSAKVFADVAGEVLIHGLALKPGKPTIVAYDQKDNTLLVGLPGNPLAAMIVWHLLLDDLFLRMYGTFEKRTLVAKLSENVANNIGRASIILVRLKNTDDGILAFPLYTKSANVKTLMDADGYILIPANKEGLRRDTYVEVVLL